MKLTRSDKLIQAANNIPLEFGNTMHIELNDTVREVQDIVRKCKHHKGQYKALKKIYDEKFPRLQYLVETLGGQITEDMRMR